jgi:hypothetical protein
LRDEMLRRMGTQSFKGTLQWLLPGANPEPHLTLSGGQWRGSWSSGKLGLDIAVEPRFPHDPSGNNGYGSDRFEVYKNEPGFFEDSLGYDLPRRGLINTSKGIIRAFTAGKDDGLGIVLTTRYQNAERPLVAQSDPAYGPSQEMDYIMYHLAPVTSLLDQAPAQLHNAAIQAGAPK